MKYRHYTNYNSIGVVSAAEERILHPKFNSADASSLEVAYPILFHKEVPNGCFY